MRLTKGALSLIKRHEGFAGMPYEDTEGYLTIGYGTKLPLEEDEADLLLEHRMRDAISEITILFPCFTSLSTTRQDVLQDMYYNLGFSRLKGFVKFRAATEAKNWAEGKKQILDSKWAKQTKTRATHLADLWEQG